MGATRAKREALIALPRGTARTLVRCARGLAVRAHTWYP